MSDIVKSVLRKIKKTHPPPPPPAPTIFRVKVERLRELLRTLEMVDRDDKNNGRPG